MEEALREYFDGYPEGNPQANGGQPDQPGASPVFDLVYICLKQHLKDLIFSSYSEFNLESDEAWDDEVLGR